MATIGLLLILYGVMDWVWTTSGGPGPLAHAAHRQRRLHGGADPGDLDAGDRAGVPASCSPWPPALFLRVTKLGTAMRAMANDREITAMLGVPVRRVEAAAWLGSGVLCGIAGLLLADLVGLDTAALTFLVIPVAGRGADRQAPLALGHARRRRSSSASLHDLLTPIAALDQLPRHDAVRARRRRPARAVPAQVMPSSREEAE